ncbi:hypothetical protein LZY01_11460 [Levilactobacillus zymae]|uniref:Uncharacterized protein n=1 Tax=Levilactobacillus zymae TaxID=267363 RepID=A0ABQ0WWS9_9LACO|nr:hypothetical protein [Levilactobacillus zymae]KRL09608.1 hypothetical protein FD38_GL002205 [Levilactobacillus zymae DSM 19395]QFR62311.1 hypothetical protein LZ395_12500 [Levilactobacillus zymae]GEO71978.1 hypothetical protein LZY01_11460 [Levilactobacillus zymae]
MQKIVMGALAVTAGVLGLALGHEQTVHASALPGTAQSAYLRDTTGYVRLKKTMDVGILKKSGKTYKPLIKKKGSLLAVAGLGGSQADKDKKGNIVIRAAFTSGAVHYQRLKQLKYHGMISVPFTKKNFKNVKLKAPVRTLLFQKGTGFKTNDMGLTTPAAFYLTLDNYLQAYSGTAMAKFAPNGGEWRMAANNVWKPTSAAKVTKVTVKGRTTTVDYRTPVKGLPNKKVAKHHYRLTIKDLNQKRSKSFFPVDDTYDSLGTWQNYKVNGKRYFVGNMENGLD